MGLLMCDRLLDPPVAPLQMLLVLLALLVLPLLLMLLAEMDPAVLLLLMDAELVLVLEAHDMSEDVVEFEHSGVNLCEPIEAVAPNRSDSIVCLFVMVGGCCANQSSTLGSNVNLI